MRVIADKVKNLISIHGTADPFQIAKALGIKVFFMPLGDNLGFYTKAYRMKRIYIHESATEQQQLFICAHELGHALLHPDENMSPLMKYTLYSISRIEAEANYFATQLLFKNGTVDPLLIKEAEEVYQLPRQVMKSTY